MILKENYDNFREVMYNMSYEDYLEHCSIQEKEIKHDFYRKLNAKNVIIKREDFERGLKLMEKYIRDKIILFLIIGLIVGLIVGCIVGSHHHSKYVPYQTTDVYVVEKGDTLWTIADDIDKNDAYDIRLIVDEIERMNHINSDLKERQVLIVPVLE